MESIVLFSTKAIARMYSIVDEPKSNLLLCINNLMFTITRSLRTLCDFGYYSSTSSKTAKKHALQIQRAEGDTKIMMG